jgi:hypothetical protein
MSIAILPFAVFLPILFLIFLVIGISVLLANRKGRSVLLWILGIVVLIPVFLFLLLIGFRLQRSQSINAAQPIFVSQSVAEVPSVWQDAIEEQFGAQVYSSPQAAAFGLGKQIADKHKELLAGQLEIIKGAEAQSKSLGPKQIILCEDTYDLNLLQEVRKGLKQSLSGLEILIQNRTSGGPSEGQVWITFSSQDEAKPFVLQLGANASVALSVEGNQSGVIEAVLQTPEDKFTEQVRYDYRIWIHDMPALKAQQNRQWVAVFSDTSTELQEAQKQVYEKACSILSQSITGSGRQTTDVLRENLEQFGLVADTYSQELAGMTGPVWRFALLLDADSEKLNELVQSKTQVVTHQRSTWIQTGLSLLGMMVIIWIAYSVANAATKGYYSVLFAILAILAMVVVGLLVFFS